MEEITVGYVENLRKQIGHVPLILVRPSVAVINKLGEILLVQYQDKSWGIPGGLMELGESVEDCARRELKEEIGIEVRNLKLIDVLSGKQLHTKLRNGDEYYNVVIGYICNEYEGELSPDGIEVTDARFYKTEELPEGTNPFIKDRIKEFGRTINRFVSNS